MEWLFSGDAAAIAIGLAGVTIFVVAWRLWETEARSGFSVHKHDGEDGVD
jgi:hypothetical protein